jgi:hypothetical protein
LTIRVWHQRVGAGTLLADGDNCLVDAAAGIRAKVAIRDKVADVDELS